MSAIVRVTGVPEIEKVLDRLDPKDRQNLERRAVRAAAKPVQAALKAVAAGARVPHSFQRVPAGRVTTHGGPSGREVAVTIRPSSPLFNIFQPGAKSHVIAPRTSGTYLRGRGSKRHAEHVGHPGVLAGPQGSGGWDGAGRKRHAAFFSSRPVRHPGLAPRDILGPAAARSQGAAMDALAAVILGSTTHAEAD